MLYSAGADIIVSMPQSTCYSTKCNTNLSFLNLPGERKLTDLFKEILAIGEEAAMK